MDLAGENLYGSCGQAVKKRRCEKYTYMVDHVQHRHLIFTNSACPYKTRSVYPAKSTKAHQEG
jgi:hypothetical protein